ncbi:hypothetical protein GCM10009067_40870 [Haloarcula sebkhae]|nr:hypothetical protein GCM10009067_40870 [Haloarcula sebkhae]
MSKTNQERKYRKSDRSTIACDESLIAGVEISTENGPVNALQVMADELGFPFKQFVVPENRAIPSYSFL